MDDIHYYGDGGWWHGWKMTNYTHPTLARLDAIAWPLGIAALALYYGQDNVLAWFLAGLCGIWMRRRLRRVAGIGRQPYVVTAWRVCSGIVYYLIFALVFWGAVTLSTHF